MSEKELLYNGTGDLDSFLEMIDMLAIAKAWKPEQVVVQAIIRLRGPALSWARKSKLKDATNWAAAQKSLQGRFGKKLSQAQALSQMSMLRRRSGETLQELADRMLDIASRSKHDFGDDVLKSCFVDGLPREFISLRSWVEESSKTFEDLVQVAIEWDGEQTYTAPRTDNGGQRATQPGPPSSQQRQQTGGGHNSSLPAPPAGAPSKADRAAWDEWCRRNGACWECGQKHLKADCPFKRPLSNERKGLSSRFVTPPSAPRAVGGHMLRRRDGVVGLVCECEDCLAATTVEEDSQPQ